MLIAARPSERCAACWLVVVARRQLQLQPRPTAPALSKILRTPSLPSCYVKPWATPTKMTRCDFAATASSDAAVDCPSAAAVRRPGRRGATARAHIRSVVDSPLHAGAVVKMQTRRSGQRAVTVAAPSAGQSRTPMDDGQRRAAGAVPEQISQSAHLAAAGRHGQRRSVSMEAKTEM